MGQVRKPKAALVLASALALTAGFAFFVPALAAGQPAVEEPQHQEIPDPDAESDDAAQQAAPEFTDTESSAVPPASASAGSKSSLPATSAVTDNGGKAQVLLIVLAIIAALGMGLAVWRRRRS